MKKKIQFSMHSQCAWLGEIKVQHVLPNKFASAIVPFVFLEHIISYKESLNESHKGLAGNRLPSKLRDGKPDDLSLRPGEILLSTL